MAPAAPRTALILAGIGNETDRWAAAFRGIEGAVVERIETAGEDDLLASLSRPGVDAAAFVTPLVDLVGAVKRSLMAGRHVFVAGGVALTSKQLLAIDGLATRRERAIVFDAAAPADQHLAFVRRMTAGPAAIWRPRYLRALRTGPSIGRSLDEVAIAEIGRVLAAVDGLPRTAQAWAPRIDDESGRSDVAMIMLSFEGGPLAQIDISLVEPSLRHELVIACEGRTLVLNQLDVAAPLQIHGSARHRGPRSEGEWAETISEHPLGEPADHLACSASGFVAAVRERSAAASNARRLADAALVWEAARESMTLGGDAVAVTNDGLDRRPLLKVIQGGGQPCAEHPLPRLTVVARR